jgi:hypothetical protein
VLGEVGVERRGRPDAAVTGSPLSAS